MVGGKYSLLGVENCATVSGGGAAVVVVAVVGGRYSLLGVGNFIAGVGWKYCALAETQMTTKVELSKSIR